MLLNKAIRQRWSPRAFSNEEVTDEMIELMFKAASRAPSARNEQPWKYVYARNGTNGFTDLEQILMEGNRAWAKAAPVLIVSMVKKYYDRNHRFNRNALHDLGAANISLAIQASQMGLQVHQMAGFDKDKATKYLELNPDQYEPVTFIAVGFPGDPEALAEDLRIREQGPGPRKELAEFVRELL